MAEKKPLTTGSFGLKKGDPVPPGVAMRLAREITAGRVQTGMGAIIGRPGGALSAKLLAERAREEQEKHIKAAVAEALGDPRTREEILKAASGGEKKAPSAPGAKPADKKEPAEDEGE